jgi:hypothetical protein
MITYHKAKKVTKEYKSDIRMFFVSANIKKLSGRVMTTKCDAKFLLAKDAAGGAN